MTFKEKREYETILDEISHLEDRIKEFENEQGDLIFECFQDEIS